MLPLKTKNPTNVGLDVVERIELFQQYHLLSANVFPSLYLI
jgi:hypothetical protein